MPFVGGPQVGYGLSDALLLEVGANLALFDGGWATGWGGVRLTHQWPVAGGRLIGEAELGGGAGAGGQVPERASSQWATLPAYGVYEGLALGMQWRWLGLYLRGRLDATVSSRAPETLWPTAMVGLEVRPHHRVSFGAGCGWWAFWNRRDHASGGICEAQLAVVFDVVPRRAE